MKLNKKWEEKIPQRTTQAASTQSGSYAMQQLIKLAIKWSLWVMISRLYQYVYANQLHTPVAWYLSRTVNYFSLLLNS